MRHSILVLAGLLVLPTPPPALSPAGARGAPTTFVFVHGAWGGGWAWRDMERRLRARGHDVLRPTLTGLGERQHLSSPEIGLSTHVRDVVNALVFEEARDVDQSLRSWTEPVALSGPPGAGLPVAYVLTRDPGASTDAFDPFAERARRYGWEVRVMEAGHVPYRTHPEALAELLVDLATDPGPPGPDPAETRDRQGTSNQAGAAHRPPGSC